MMTQLVEPLALTAPWDLPKVEDLHTGEDLLKVENLQTVEDLQTLDLQKLNQRFDKAAPWHILAWCWAHLPQGLVQASAFGVDDMLLTDLLYRPAALAGGNHHTQDATRLPAVPVVFLDTLFHFPQTLAFVATARAGYRLNLKIYGPLGMTSREMFQAKFGPALWERDLAQFHRVTKVEPLMRGLDELGAIAWITGRRRDQSSTRAELPIFEWDRHQRLKVNPLANWTRKDTWAYVFEHDVPYNPLHDRGYPSIGDEPLTVAVRPGEDERAGRWRGMEQLECGIHL